MKTPEEILEGNTLIGDFMYPKAREIFDLIPENSDIEDDSYFHLEKMMVTMQDYSKLRYYHSWNSIMPVVEKIENTTHHMTIKGCLVTMPGIVNTAATTKLEAVWLACVEFIRWYNNQNQK